MTVVRPAIICTDRSGVIHIMLVFVPGDYIVNEVPELGARKQPRSFFLAEKIIGVGVANSFFPSCTLPEITVSSLVPPHPGIGESHLHFVPWIKHWSIHIHNCAVPFWPVAVRWRVIRRPLIPTEHSIRWLMRVFLMAKQSTFPKQSISSLLFLQLPIICPSGFWECSNINLISP